MALALSPLNVEALYLLPWCCRSYLRLPTLAMCACAHAIALLHSATMLTFGVRLLAAVNARADDFDEGRRGAIYAALYTSLPLAAAGLLLRGRFCAISTRALLKLRTRLAGAEQVSKGRLSVRQRRGPTGQQGVALPSEGRLSFVELAPPGNRRSTLVLAPHWSSDRSSSSSDRNSKWNEGHPFEDVLEAIVEGDHDRVFKVLAVLVHHRHGQRAKRTRGRAAEHLAVGLRRLVLRIVVRPVE